MLVLDKRKRPLQPCRPDRARKLLACGRARVHRAVPFTIRLVDRLAEESVVEGVEIGIDPGSKTTGIAVYVSHEQTTPEAGASARDLQTSPATGVRREGVLLAEVTHRGGVIRKKLAQRSGFRGRRRSTLRYRAPRFLNRHPAACTSCGANAQRGRLYCRPCKALPRDQRGQVGRKKKLPPSLQHRVDTTMSWVHRLTAWAPVTRISVEVARFDTHVMHEIDVKGVAYQHGSLYDREVREYLYAKWGRACVYCDATGVPLTKDQVLAKANGGSDRSSNLVPACYDCNQDKDNHPLEVFLAHDPVRAERIRRTLKAPLRDAAMMNATRYTLTDRLRSTGIQVEASTGGRTKHNRSTSDIPKTHALDALCVGDVDAVTGYPAQTLHIRCTGRGSHQRTRSDKYGFPRLYLTRVKSHYGYITGDRVCALVPRGKNAGAHVGRVAVRSSGSFNIATPTGLVQGINYRHLTLLDRGDGYTYHHIPTQQRERTHPCPTSTFPPHG